MAKLFFVTLSVASLLLACGGEACPPGVDDAGIDSGADAGATWTIGGACATTTIDGCHVTTCYDANGNVESTAKNPAADAGADACDNVP